MSSSAKDQNVKDYIALQKERITAYKQAFDRVIELSNSADQGTTTFSDLKNSDEQVKNDFSICEAKEKETKKFLNNHSDIKDKVNQANPLSVSFLGED